jgi:hypothetical protein
MPHRAVRSVLVCAALAACAQTASVTSGPPQAADAFSDKSPSSAQADVRLILVATPAAGESRTFQFVGEITGGADNNPDLYCQATTWAFGDGPGLTVTPSCAPWSADVKIRRRFENTHTYEQRGTYTATFTYGALTAQVSVEAR